MPQGACGIGGAAAFLRRAFPGLVPSGLPVHIRLTGCLFACLTTFLLVLKFHTPTPAPYNPRPSRGLMARASFYFLGPDGSLYDPQYIRCAFADDKVPTDSPLFSSVPNPSDFQAFPEFAASMERWFAELQRLWPLPIVGPSLLPGGRVGFAEPLPGMFESPAQYALSMRNWLDLSESLIAKEKP